MGLRLFAEEPRKKPTFAYKWRRCSPSLSENAFATEIPPTSLPRLSPLSRKFVSHLAQLKTSISVILKLNFPGINFFLLIRAESVENFSSRRNTIALVSSLRTARRHYSKLAEAIRILKVFFSFFYWRVFSNGNLFAVLFVSLCLISPLKVPHIVS